ncbi:RNA polymerase [Sosuga virus]|uniref:RNA-directed RNA polymerase L n=1 Tax=Sosuga virus TaxID=1452514 RepID=W5S5N8_9MONO|nr:RNA polymerase [Sosuga virus]AHH02041.1 RNA polymerase [Sosuga virus]AVT50851.1 L [Expression vector pSOSV_FL-vc] [Expression vector pSOSV_FL-vc]AVT50856.1 L [Expression vector pSOSV/ZsG-FL] [Expression vector pSOSV/ZsG-FL]
MAAPAQIILPEVHLDSPIVENKLLYLIQLGELPTYDYYYNHDYFPGIDWSRIRHEESKIFQRLSEVKERLLAKCLSSQRKRKNLSLNFNPVPWPKCMTILHRVIINSSLERFKDAEHIISHALAPLSPGLTTLLEDVSSKITGKQNLFQQNIKSCSFHPNHSRPNSVMHIATSAFQVEWKDNFNQWFLIRHLMRQLIMRNSEGHTQITPVEIDDRIMSVIITPELVTIWLSENNTIIYLTFEMVLMITDLYEGRMNMMLLTTLSCYLAPLKSRLKQLFIIVDDLSSIIGNSVYSIVASMESLVYGQLQLSDPVPDVAGEFYSFVVGEMLTALTDTKEFTTDEARIVVERITECYEDLTPDLIAELLCVMRMWGHPSLSAEKAAEKVRKSMCAPKIIDLETTLKTLAFFHGILINGYRRKHNGIWPKCRLPPNAGVSLTEMKHDNSELPHQYILNHWKEIAFIEFEKSFDSDPGDDLSIFMKDKAISAPKSDWMSVFRKSLIKPTCERLHAPMPRPFNRRLLLNFLADSNFDPSKELEYVTTGAYLEDEEFCASYSLKEKEIKETGRIFAKLTKNMRSCQVMAESLLANHAGKLFKENGVVQDNLNLTKSLLTMSQIGLISRQSRRNIRENVTILHKVTKNHHQKFSSAPSTKTGQKSQQDEQFEIAAFYLTTDLEKYCLNWRYQTIIMFATSMNRLYGYPHLFEWIHPRLMRSTLYVGDPFNMPRYLDTTDLDLVKNEGIFIVSPRGGIEGLCQKLWTMISISVIILSAAESNTRVMSMVQGDNQAVGITTRVPRCVSTKEKKRIAFENSKAFIERLRVNNHNLGHHLKSQETILSSSFFVYSKRIFSNGRILNQALKNMSKANLISDVLGECTQSSCSNLTTTLMRLTENGVEKDICYWLSFFLSAKQLVYDLLFPLLAQFEDEVTSTYLNNPHLIGRLCAIPSQLGGLNYYSLSRLFCRNIGDPLTSATADLKRLIQHGVLPEWYLNNLFKRKPGDGNWTTLAADPYALNIDYIYPPTSFLKKHTQRVLMEHSTNPMLAGVFVESSYSEELDLAKFLLDRPMVMPRVAHIIVEQTSCGRRKQVQGYLDTTRTMIKHAITKQPPSFRKLEKIINYNKLYLGYNLEMIQKPVGGRQKMIEIAHISDLCSIDISKILRRISWSSLLTGRPLEGLETPDPIELINGSLIDGCNICHHCLSGDRKFTWFFIPSGIELDTPPEDNPPMRVPYVGSRTDERRVASIGYVKGASPSLKSALRLAGVYIWAFGDTENNWEDALDLANTRVYIEMDQLKTLTPMPTSANLTHRLDDGLTQMKFTPASSYAYSCFVHISNDNQNLEQLDRLLDSNLIYQQVMILGLGVIETWLSFPNQINDEDISVHLHTGGSCCIRPVDMCVLNESPNVPPTLNVPHHNKFIFDSDPLDKDQIEVIDNVMIQSRLCGIDCLTIEERIPLLAHLISLQFAHTLTGLDESTSLINDAVVDADYSANWISECLNTYLDKVFYYTAWNIMLDLAYQMYYMRIIGLHSIIDYLNIVLTRIPGLALTGISSTINHPKILRRLINLGILVPKNSPYLATLNYHKLATEAIMWGAHQALADIRTGVDIELIIPSEDSTELSDRTLNLVARKLTLIAIAIADNPNLPYVRGLAPDQKCKVLTEYLLVQVKLLTAEPEKLAMWKTVICEPKMSAFPHNLYYLTRKILNSIRESPLGQTLIDQFYSSFGFLESDPNMTLMNLASNLGGEFQSLTVFDVSKDIYKESDDNERYHYPFLSQDSVDQTAKFAAPPTHHILRPIGLSSTSWYKGISIINYLANKRVPLGNHLYLAEGSGALMTIIEAYYPGEKIYYNSFFSSGQCPPQRNFQPLPTQFTESIIYQHLINNIPCELGFVQEFLPLWSGNSKQTDLSKRECVEFILSQVSTGTVSLLVCDLEEGFISNNCDLSCALIHVLLLSFMLIMDNGLLILKSDLEPFQKLSTIVSILSYRFKNITLARSAYSDPQSSEVFLICLAGPEKTVGTFNVARALAQQDKMDGFSLINPCVLKDLREEMAESCNNVIDVIDMQLKMAHALENQDDHVLLSRLGSRSQTNQLLQTPQANTIQEVIERIANLVTIYLKETLTTIESYNEDRTRLLFLAYNISAFGKIRTSAQLTARAVLDIVIRNWPIIDFHMRKVVIASLKLGEFSVSLVLTPKSFLSITHARKYFSQNLGLDQLDIELGQNLKVLLPRSEQKLIWKNIGCINLISTLEDDNNDFRYEPYPDESQDQPEFDLAGDEI